MQGPFTVTVEVPYGTAVSNISGAVGGQPTVGSNGTLAINFTVSGSLPANAAGYTFVNTSILASSQASKNDVQQWQLQLQSTDLD